MVINKSAKLLWLLLLGLLSFSPAMGQEIKEVRKTVSLRPDGRVAVHTFKSSVTVTAWDSPTVDIYARIEPDGSGPEESEKVRNTEIRIEASADAISLQSDYQKLRASASNALDETLGSLPFIPYTIQMLRTAKLDIKGHKSQIQVTGLLLRRSTRAFWDALWL